MKPESEGTNELQALCRLKRRLQARVRARVPAHAVEELVDAALVGAFVRQLETRSVRCLDALALRIANDLCNDWHRFRSRHGNTLPLSAAGQLAEDLVDHGPPEAHRLREDLERLAPDVYPFLTPRQRHLFDLILSGEVPSMSAARRRIGASLGDLGEMIALIAKKVLRVVSNPRPSGGSPRC